MKIELLKQYIDTTGAITTPMTYVGEDGSKIEFICFVKGEPRCYTPEGKYLTDGEHLFDLVAEYKGPPVFIKPSAYFSSEEKIPTDDDCMAYTEQNDDDTSLPLLNIFKPLRTQDTHRPAHFLARADDGSYLIQIGDDWDEVGRFRTEELNGIFENVPEPEVNRAVVRMYQNGDYKVFMLDSTAQQTNSIPTCEITYSDEQGWQVRDLKGDK